MNMASHSPKVSSIIFLIFPWLVSSFSFVSNDGPSLFYKPNTKRYATIIGWDDGTDSSMSSSFDSSYSNILNEDDDPTYSSSSSQHHYHQPHIFNSIADNLSHNRDQLASLARLAVAFSPPNQAMDLNQINDIHIIAVTNDHIELSAVVCDQVECVTLMVPITFPHYCNSDDSSDEATETCILDNIIELDIEAQQVLKQRDVEQKFLNAEGTKDLMEALYNHKDLDFPSWWIEPKSNEMTIECKKIKSILNEDTFQTQVKALAKEGLSYCEDGELFEIYRAVVSAIGPGGFYFRAIACSKSDNNNSMKSNPQSDDDKQYAIVDIPYCMLQQLGNDGNNEITEPSALRSVVLGTIASIE